jgi:hypothetical protein
MTVADVVIDGFDRIRQVVHGAVRDLTEEQLAERLDPGANSAAWLVWHLTRIQDDHVAGVAGTDQVWYAEGWAARFGLPFPTADTGYAHDSEEVAAVRVHSNLLVGYHDAVHDGTVSYLADLREDDLGRIVDEYWDPPVTLAVRLVSVISDDLQHVGQAAYVRGLRERLSH